METMRKYGNQPYHIAVIHGGPGAPGTMGPVAKELSKKISVIEPFQAALSIDEQILELKTILENESNSAFPVILIGHSWGAWLSYIFAAKYPKLVKKLILIGSGSFETKYVSAMNKKRKNSLSEEENNRVGILYKQLVNKFIPNKKDVLKEFGALMSKADSFSPISNENDTLDFNIDIFNNCMKEINVLRNSKELLNLGRDIECPVIAIHGEYDSHSYEGVEKPLSNVLKDFKFILLEKCGHTPWNEFYAKDEFYEILFNEII